MSAYVLLMHMLYSHKNSFQLCSCILFNRMFQSKTSDLRINRIKGRKITSPPESQNTPDTKPKNQKSAIATHSAATKYSIHFK
jgi:hypothetical protein